MTRTLEIDAYEPDNKVTVDFHGTNSRRKKDRRACRVELTVENGQLYVVVKGCDDRVSILHEQTVDLPAEDTRH